MKPKQIKTSKKTKFTKILAVPFIAIAFLLGWVLYFTGDKKAKRSQKNIGTPIGKETITLMMIPPPEETIKN